MKPNASTTIFMKVILPKPFHSQGVRWPSCTVVAFCVLALSMCCCGCADGKKSGKGVGASGGGGLKPKMTDDIGEFQPEDGKPIVDSTVKYTNPITGPLDAFDPIKQQISEGQITQLVEMFRATEGRYPKDYAEFKKRVIDENGMRLPALGTGKRYQYDVVSHKLVVVMEGP